MPEIISAKLLLASQSAITEDILYTFELQYPRIILAEVNTHRALSRNTSSSRAIPSKRIRNAVSQQPFVPKYIGQAQRGMQAGVELNGWRRSLAETVWAGARYPALGAAWCLEKLGAHKQVANRLLEPWMWVTQCVSATDVDNLLKLRNDEMAEPHFHDLARQISDIVNEVRLHFAVYQMKRGIVESQLQGGGYEQTLHHGEWHLPYLDWEEQLDLTIEEAKKVSTARCARTSYTLLASAGRSHVQDDIALCDRLAESGHWSCFEHIATPLMGRNGNFNGWLQYRKEFEGESGVVPMKRYLTA